MNKVPGAVNISSFLFRTEHPQQQHGQGPALRLTVSYNNLSCQQLSPIAASDATAMLRELISNLVMIIYKHLVRTMHGLRTHDLSRSVVI